MAGNKGQEYGPEHFVVDKTVPEIKIEKLKHRSANNGKIEAEAAILDPYLDIESLEILCTGEKRGEKKLKYKILEIQGGKKLYFQIFHIEKKKMTYIRCKFESETLLEIWQEKKSAFQSTDLDLSTRWARRRQNFWNSIIRRKGRHWKSQRQT